MDIDQPWCVLAHISGRGRKFVLASVYLAPTDDIEPKLAYLGEALEKCRPAEILVCMDANARSPVRHSDVTNARGRVLEAFLDTHSLKVIKSLNRVNDIIAMSAISAFGRR
ncbi:UNVERIFIED_CONTAM: hypothetical protein PYX00_011039 [Menopon gallinae]|uniref:Endonuclease/exonuclease/phosphatase domain-containing protein n=1 Tax=Menopon gallinae TaxID=328185 RepID=A0AAW2H664_9NEOP